MTASSDLATLLRLRWALLRQSLRSAPLRHRLRGVAVVLVTLVLMGGEGYAAARVFGVLQAHQDLGPWFVLALVERLLGLVFLTSLSLLVFSHAITALQTLYLSRDLALLASTPARPLSLFAYKLIETVVLSSYMVLAFTIPILVGYGWSFGAGPLFYLQILPTLGAYVLGPAGLGVLLTVLLMRYVPARRVHEALTVLGVAGGVTLVVLLRLTRPERLLRPSSDVDLHAFLRAITLPAAEHLPSTWAARVQMAAIGGDLEGLLRNGGLLLVLAGLSLGLAFLAARSGYARGMQGAHEGRRRVGGGPAAVSVSLIGRDLRLFKRDPSQWSQLLLLGALVVLYVFNVTALPRDLLELEGMRLGEVIAWLNGALAGLVLSAIGLRFVLPSTSFEGGAFWAVLSSPLGRGRYVLVKFLFFLPLGLFALVLVLLANLALGIRGPMMPLTLVTAGVASVTLTGLGVGLGAAFPVFRLENPAQMMFTPGGLLYGASALVYLVGVLIVEARPVWLHVTGGVPEPGLLLSRGLALLLLSAAFTLIPLGYGVRRLRRLEA